LNYLPKGVIIGGSTILRSVYKQNQTWEPHDADFYFKFPEGEFQFPENKIRGGLGISSSSFLQKNIWKMDSLLRGLGETVIFKTSSCVITYIIRLSKQKEIRQNDGANNIVPKHFVAQLILPPTTMDVLLASYHGDLVSVAYDSTTKNFYFSDRFKRFIETGESRFTNVLHHHSAGIKKAFLKYKQRGFKIIEAFDNRVFFTGPHRQTSSISLDATSSTTNPNNQEEEDPYSKSVLLDTEDFLKSTTFTDSLKNDVLTTAASQVAKYLQKQRRTNIRGISSSSHGRNRPIVAEMHLKKTIEVNLLTQVYERLSDCLGEEEVKRIGSYLEMFIELYHVKICKRCEKMVILEDDDEAVKKYLSRAGTNYICKRCFYEMMACKKK
jgi:hypothetical protein